VAGQRSGERDETLTLRERSHRIEADEIRAALASCNGDREAVCKALGISKTTLSRKLNGTASRK
jgi:propionate catabolism operon transcriptional regulator